MSSIMDRESATVAVRSELASLTKAMGSMRPFTINNRMWAAAELVPLLVVDPGNLDVHLAQCAAWVAFWGVSTADAKHFHDEKQAAYRIARDTWATRRRAEGKITKDAVEEEWRAQPDYQRWYTELAEAERAWNAAQFLYEAFKAKTTMLGALARLYDGEAMAQAATRGPRR